MKRLITKMVMVIASTLTLTGLIDTSAQPPSYNWPTVKLCGKASNASPLQGHLWLSNLDANTSNINQDTITTLTSTDSGKTPLKILNASNSAGFRILNNDSDELLYLNVDTKAASLNFIKHSRQIISLTIDQSQVQWYEVAPLLTTGHYRVLAVDKLKFLDSLDIDATNQVNVDSLIKISDSPIKIGDVVTSFSLSPSGNFVFYGYTSEGLAIYSIQDQRIIATFGISGNTFTTLSWSADPQVLAYAASGSLSRTFKYYSIAKDGSNHELLDLKSLIESGGFISAASQPDSQNQNDQIITVLTREGIGSQEHVFILDVANHRIIDNCIDSNGALTSWIDNTHMLIIARLSDGTSNALIVSTQTGDYYKITYDPSLFPIGWVSDSNPLISTPTP